MKKQSCIDVLVDVFFEKTEHPLSTPIINVHTVYAAPKKRKILPLNFYQQDSPYICWWDLENNAHEVDVQALLLDHHATKDSTIDTILGRIPSSYFNAPQAKLFSTLGDFHLYRTNNPPQSKTEASHYTTTELSILLHAFFYQTERSYQNPFKTKKTICHDTLSSYIGTTRKNITNRHYYLPHYQNCRDPIFELTSGIYDPKLHKQNPEITDNQEEAAQLLIDAFVEALSHFNKQFHMAVQTETIGLQDQLLMAGSRAYLEHLNNTLTHNAANQ
tara:strand:- start:39241 stop:40062 length:822 start_codon:yes stop_codon:yes gene_type:complete